MFDQNLVVNSIDCTTGKCNQEPYAQIKSKQCNGHMLKTTDILQCIAFTVQA